MPDLDSARSLMIARGNEARSVRVMVRDIYVIRFGVVGVDESTRQQEGWGIATALYIRNR